MTLRNAFADLSTEATVEAVRLRLVDILTELGTHAAVTDTQPVSAASLPLPTGAATEVSLDTAITRLTSILAAVDGLEASATASATEVTLVALLAAVDGLETNTTGQATETTLASILAAVDGLEAALAALTVTVANPGLTDAEIRATPLDVTSALLHAEDSVTPLTGAATFDGSTVDAGATPRYATQRAFVYADVAGTLSVQQSRDGTNWRTVDTAAVAAGESWIVDVPIALRYCRLSYLNGASAQGAFELFHTLVPVGG